MDNIFGFSLISREEREARRKAFESVVFPGGMTQRRELRKKLRESFPRIDGTLMMYFYISIKEQMKKNGLGFDDAVKKLGKTSVPPKFKNEDLPVLKRILEEDMRDEHDRYSQS